MSRLLISIVGFAALLTASPAHADHYDRYYHDDRDDEAVAGAVTGYVAGRGYGYGHYGYPRYGYGYAYPRYAYPRYGYAYPAYRYAYPYAVPAYPYPSPPVVGYYGTPYGGYYGGYRTYVAPYGAYAYRRPYYRRRY